MERYKRWKMRKISTVNERQGLIAFHRDLVMVVQQYCIDLFSPNLELNKHTFKKRILSKI